MGDSLYDRAVAALGEQYHVESEIGRGGMSRRLPRSRQTPQPSSGDQVCHRA
jgi:hypothetical protein